VPLWEASLRHIVAASRAASTAELDALLRCAEEGGALVALEDVDALALPAAGPAALAVVRWLERTRATVLLHAPGAAALDPAVARHVTLDVPFAPPHQATRVQLWLRALPELADDARALAQALATGGQIVAWAARARRLAAIDGEPLALRHIRQILDRAHGVGHGR
jgi:hypothetical protein